MVEGGLVPPLCLGPMVRQRRRLGGDHAGLRCRDPAMVGSPARGRQPLVRYAADQVMSKDIVGATGGRQQQPALAQLVTSRQELVLGAAGSGQPEPEIHLPPDHGCQAEQRVQVRRQALQALRDALHHTAGRGSSA